MHVNLPDEPDYSIFGLLPGIFSGDIGQHSSTLYQYTSHKIAEVNAKYDFDISNHAYVIGTIAGADASLNGTEGSDVIIGDARADPSARDRTGPDLSVARDDALFGNGGADVVFGGLGVDTLHGGASNDILDGGSGSDTLWGDIGNDLLDGGSGDDTYGLEISFNYGHDIISDSQGQDTILIYGGSLINNRGQIHLDRDGHDLVITIVTGSSAATWETITIKSMDAASSQVETLKVKGADGLTTQFTFDLVTEFNGQSATQTPPPAPPPVTTPPTGNSATVGAPQLTAQPQLMLTGTSIPASALAAAAADLPIARFEITDQAGKGHFLLNGNLEPDGATFQVSAGTGTAEHCGMSPALPATWS